MPLISIDTVLAHYYTRSPPPSTKLHLKPGLSIVTANRKARPTETVVVVVDIYKKEWDRDNKRERWMCNNTVYSIQMRCTLGTSQLLTIVPWSVMAVQMFCDVCSWNEGFYLVRKFSFRLWKASKGEVLFRQKSRQVNVFSELINTSLLDGN